MKSKFVVVKERRVETAKKKKKKRLCRKRKRKINAVSLLLGLPYFFKL